MDDCYCLCQFNIAAKKFDHIWREVVINSGRPAVDVPITGFQPLRQDPSAVRSNQIYDGDRSSTDSFAFKQKRAALFYTTRQSAYTG